MSDAGGTGREGAGDPRHQRVKALFARAAELPAGARAAFLDSECGDDASLRAELESLIGHADAMTTADFAGSIPRMPPAAQPDPLLGATIAGRYRVLGVIGEGGFGLVYEAEQVAPVRRRVALKVLKPGMDSKAILARFEAERQALAVMDHPCIAKVLDAGETDRGLPFFVMELVKGSPITDYCDRQRLTIQQRLDLFARVCEAIQHAHTKAIIHRDIKPSNILVEVPEGAEPTPKVIDFGIAKAMAQKLTEQTLFTERGQMIGTPEYMSPEQAEMGAGDIDTRSDVYALGVLLYELLTGERPFDLRRAAILEIQRVIREVEPPKPSTRLTGLGETATRIAECRRTDPRTLSGTLRKELEWIPLKALRKDRTERYRSAADLGDDVRRYLAGEALEAGPESASYRLRKFVRRNRGPVLAVAAVFAALVLGVIGTGYGLVTAERETKRANAEATAAREAEAQQARLVAEATRERDAAEEARRTIESSSYIANVQMASEDFESRRFGRVRQRLDACPEHLRGWEWFALDARSDRSLVRILGHTRPVESASFSPDGTRIVSVSYGSARVWDAATGESLAELTGHTVFVCSASFSPDGTRIVTASRLPVGVVDDLGQFPGLDGKRRFAESVDRTARVWDATTGASIIELTGHTGPVVSASFSPDGTRIVTASDNGTARIWDASTGESLAQLNGHSGEVSSASYSADGTRIVTASADNTARVWDAATGARLAVLAGHEEPVKSASFSPDGTRIITTAVNRTARIWNAATGTSCAELTGHTGGVRSASFSPDGTRIVTTSWDHTAQIWEASTGELLAELIGHRAQVVSASFSPDGTRIVTASSDSTARTWDAATGESIAELTGHIGAVVSASFSPDGTRIITSSLDKTTRIWDASTGASIAELTEAKQTVNSASFSPDWTRIVTAPPYETARVWVASTGESLVVLTGHTREVLFASFSLDGTRIVTASADRTARVWDASTGESLVVLTGHTWEVQFASFSRDGTRIVTASADTARVWDAATGESLAELSGHRGLVRTASFNPDGTRIVTASEDRTARVWDASTGASIIELTGHSGPVVSASFSPDGKRIVTASWDSTARIWDASTGASIIELTGHSGPVVSASFSPDGKRIVTASWDSTARIWGAATGASLAELTRLTSPRSASFSSDGTRVITELENCTARVWDAVPYRIRYAERRANERGEDGAAIVRVWLEEVGWNPGPAVPPRDN
jgi:WD40 repeat protein/tRNA A-37 threonylcarbamoyl transferase component Bud32